MRQWVKILGAETPEAARQPAMGPLMLAYSFVTDYAMTKGNCSLICRSDGPLEQRVLQGFVDITNLQVIALYPSETVAESARKRIQQAKLAHRIVCRVGDVHALPFAESSFDGVVSVSGAVAQQLAEDYPDTVEKMQKLKIAVGYHGGAGHNPRGPHRQQPDIRGPSPDDAIRALWTFETRALYSDNHPQAGKPIPNVLGGWLTIQTALGVMPLQTDAAGRGALFESLGAGYAMSQDESSDALPLLGLHEIHFYGDSGRFVVPPT